ncbi:hypothetical protein ABT288_30310 [Streptomyces sp. NPDC001093]|uniref:hypothetical protein n=1 Tax=Streptomyces sp. NPDC001093 TaxID=3154376 RepID=UPI003322C63E
MTTSTPVVVHVIVGRLDTELKPFGDVPADVFLPVDSGPIFVLGLRDTAVDRGLMMHAG